MARYALILIKWVRLGTESLPTSISFRTTGATCTEPFAVNTVAPEVGRHGAASTIDSVFRLTLTRKGIFLVEPIVQRHTFCECFVGNFEGRCPG